MKSRRSCLLTRTARRPDAARQHSLRPAQPKAAAGQRCLRAPHAPRSASKPAPPSAGFKASASPLPVVVVVEELSGLSGAQRSFLPAKRMQRAVPVPQLRRPAVESPVRAGVLAAQQRRFLERLVPVQLFGPGSRRSGDAESHQDLVLRVGAQPVAEPTTTSPLPVFPSTPVVSRFSRSGSGVSPVLRLVCPVTVHGLAVVTGALAEVRQPGLAPATAEPCRSQRGWPGRSCSSPSAGFRRRPACRRCRPLACPGSGLKPHNARCG